MANCSRRLKSFTQGAFILLAIWLTAAALFYDRRIEFGNLLAAPVAAETVAAPLDLTEAWFYLRGPAEITHTLSMITPTVPIYGEIEIAEMTGAAGPAAAIRAQVGYGPFGSYPDESWFWFEMNYETSSEERDIYAGRLQPTATGFFHMAVRWSSDDGQTWFYADRDGPGYEPERGGRLLVILDPDATPPAAPELQLLLAQDEFIRLGWQPGAERDLAGYEIYRRQDLTQPFERHITLPADTATYTDTAVVKGQMYEYYILAYNFSYQRSVVSNFIRAHAAPRPVQVTFQVTGRPHTPLDDRLFIVGDHPALCDWCDPQEIPLHRISPTTWERTITLPEGATVQYRYTRGSLQLSEWSGPDMPMPERQIEIVHGQDGRILLNDYVVYWRDPLVIFQQPSPGATLLDPVDVELMAVLSRHLDPATINNANIHLRSSQGDYPLEIKYEHHREEAATTLRMRPGVPLAYQETYTVTLETGLAGLAADNGQIPLQRQYQWQFYTDCQNNCLHIERVYLQNELLAEGIQLTGQIYVRDSTPAGNPVAGVTMTATWTLPDGRRQRQQAETNLEGVAELEISGAPGLYDLTVNRLEKAGYHYRPRLALANYSLFIPDKRQSLVNNEVAFSSEMAIVNGKYTWDFGDGSPTGTGRSVTHTYEEPGLYTVTLEISHTTRLLTVRQMHEVVPPAPVSIGEFPDQLGSIQFWSSVWPWLMLLIAFSSLIGYFLLSRRGGLSFWTEGTTNPPGEESQPPVAH